MIRVTFLTNGGKVVEAQEGANLLHVSVRGQGGIPFKCGGGVCGTCRCLIEQGREHCEPIKPKERKHLTESEFAAGYRMACQTGLRGDVSVSWAPRPAAGAAPAAARPDAQTAAQATQPPAPADLASLRDEAFGALGDAARRRMLEIGPRWAQDILSHRQLVLRAYTPVLAQAPREGIAVERDLAYGAHPRQRLDVYRAAGTSGAPVVLFVHGGAFVRGEKDATPEVYGNVTRWFARHGCVGVNMEYRLAGEAPYPGGAQDVALAVAWLREHAAAHGGDPDRIVLVGHSAGAAHAGAYACDPVVRPAGGHGLAALALISGRVRADARPDNPNAAAVRAYYGEDESLYEARSVVTHAASIDVPLFLAVAEYENPYLDAYMAELAWRVGMTAGRMPRFVQLPAHNHTSIVAHFDSGEDRLGRELLRFVRDATRG